MIVHVYFKLLVDVVNTEWLSTSIFIIFAQIVVSLDPDDEKLLEEDAVNLPDKKRYLHLLLIIFVYEIWWCMY